MFEIHWIECYSYFLLQILSMSEDSETGPDGKKKGQKKAKKSNKSKANQRKNSKKSNTPQTGNNLSAKIFATMDKHKEVFFVIRLHSAQSAASLSVSYFWIQFYSFLFLLVLDLIFRISIFPVYTRSRSSYQLWFNGRTRCFPHNGKRETLWILIFETSEIQFNVHVIRVA